MAKHNKAAQYFADDKDLLDLIESSPKKLTDDRLRAVCLQRGIIVSPEESRTHLARYVATLPHAWPDVSKLLDVATGHDRTPRRTVERVTLRGCSVDAVQLALEEVQSVRASRDETIRFFLNPETNTARISIEYTKLDSGVTRLRQKTLHEVEIDLSISSEGIEVQRHDDERASEVTTGVLGQLSMLLNVEAERDRIDLAGVTSCEGRTRFFIELMRSIEGYSRVVDVSRVHVSKFAPEADSDDDRERDEPEEAGEATRAVRARVEDLMLRGGDLLLTPEYQSFAKECFIDEVSWRLAGDAADAPEVELEAGFNQAREGTGFFFKVRGVFERIREGEGEVRRNRKGPSISAASNLNHAIEAAARRALEIVTGGGGTAVEGDETGGGATT